MADTPPGATATTPPAPTVPDEPRWVDNPYGPHDTTGTNLRFGSAVGYLVHDDRTYTALGAAVAAGPRIGRFTFEADYMFLALSAPGPSDLHFGRAQRLGAMARVDVIRLGSDVLGPNSMLAIYGEVGAARQWHAWSRPGMHEASRAVPVDSSATIGVIGFGVNLDHRLEKPLNLSRVGWQLGWQLTSTPTRQADPMLECRGGMCAAAAPAPVSSSRNTALLVTSTIAFTW